MERARRLAITRTITCLLAGAAAVSSCTRTRAAPGGPPPPDGGEVVIACGAAEEWCAATTRAFTARTGIGSRFVRLSSGEAVARIRFGRDAPEFDVWHGGPADGYAAADRYGLLANYRSPNAAAIPAEYKDPDGTWTGVYLGVLGFCSNTAVLAAKGLVPPRSWAELLHPALRQNVGIAHPATSGTAYTALWTQVARHGGDVAAALRYMRALHPNVLQYSKSGGAPAQQVAFGEVGVSVVFSHDCVATREQGYTHLRVTFPREGTGYEVGGIALIKGARNPVSARRYVDWALTPQAQEVGQSVGSYQVPTHPAARRFGMTVILSSVTLVDYDTVAAGARKTELTRRFDAEVGKAPKP
ncbi:iron ABC transporter substrate-binding protein [Spongiactinospora rosea]|uniref:Iron ABC transporter substrate-binding protein n=1 Tax=Spongiactinospora rosea TaxID=2248750 RepID=A0A366LNH9_9ACTN|nr:ABC transporter substrate-binding protein [Spongiactinospora rosea]RBQ15053.1 iron ABC transporter substrate-binding protein [Spongiactinospora rosea]